MKNRLQYKFTKLVTDQLIEFKYYYFFAVIFLFFTHKIQSDLPFMAKNLADLIGHDSDKINVSKFFWYALGIIIFRTSSRILFFYPARILQKYLRDELLVKIQNAYPGRYRQYSAGQLFQFLTGDIDQIRALIGFVGLQGGNFVIGMLVLVPKLMAFNTKLMWALSPMIVSFFIFTFIVSKNREYFKKTQEAQGDVQNIIIESYQGKKTIKNFQAEAPFIHLFESLSLKELNYFYLSSLGISVTLPLIAFGIGLSMLWGAYIIKINQLGSGTLILFSGFIFLFMEPMSYLSWIGVVVSRSYASWRRLNLLDDCLITKSLDEEKLLILNSDTNPYHYVVNFWNDSLDFKIHQNKINILVSKTGHGKTVVLEQIGEVLKLKKQKVSMVFQDPYIYNDTLVNNIYLGRSIDLEMRENAKVMLKIFGLDYLEHDLDKLLDLEVGENGKRLSGGQAKRLALVRSILSDADFLIWDDPFSSVDLILEKEIMQNLKNTNVFKNKTLIITSHRLTTLRNSDEFIFIDKEAKILESGSTSLINLKTSFIYEYFKQQMV